MNILVAAVLIAQAEVMAGLVTLAIVLARRR
jgi:hypothetical protein